MGIKGNVAKYVAIGLLSFITCKSLAQDAGEKQPAPTIQTTDWKDVFSVVAYAESESLPSGWVPLLGLVPDINMSVKFGNKFTLFARTNYFIHNWNDPKTFVIDPFSMFVGGTVKTRAGEFTVRVGHTQPHLKYTIEGRWDLTSPLGPEFFTAVNFNTSGNTPKGASLTWSYKNTNISAAYGEMDPKKSGFAFDGTNPTLLTSVEQSFADGALSLKGATA